MRSDYYKKMAILSLNNLGNYISIIIHYTFTILFNWLFVMWWLLVCYISRTRFFFGFWNYFYMYNFPLVRGFSTKNSVFNLKYCTPGHIWDVSREPLGKYGTALLARFCMEQTSVEQWNVNFHDYKCGFSIR